MSIQLRCNFVTDRGREFAERIESRKADLNTHCSCSGETCTVTINELPDKQVLVTVTRPRAVANGDDWTNVKSDAGKYIKIFDDPTDDDLVVSIGQMLERPLVARVAVVTTEEFLSKLAEVREQFYWGFNKDLGRHADRRARPRLAICASTKIDESIEFGPIGALCYALTTAVCLDEYEAAKAIGLSSSSAWEVIAATNDGTWKGVEGQRKPDPRLRSIRKQLIETVGLDDSI